MSDQTPDVPDLWFSSSEGVIETGRVNGYWLVSRPVHSFTDTLPTDAVRLGNVEGLKREIREAIGIYFDVDADDPRTDGAEMELADAIHALEAVQAIVNADLGKRENQ